MNSSERESYIQYRLAKSKETLEAAELLVENGKWNSAVNRLYYAIYYAVSSLVMKEDIEAKTHSGVKTQFLLHFVKTERIDAKLGRLYSDLFDWRQKGDYSDFFDFTEEDVRPLLKPVEELIATIQELITKMD